MATLGSSALKGLMQYSLPCGGINHAEDWLRESVLAHAGNREMKGRPLSRLRFHPNLSPMAFHDFFANGKPNPRAGVLVAGVQALKNDKNTLIKFGIDPNPIVRYPKVPERSMLFTGRVRLFF